MLAVPGHTKLELGDRFDLGERNECLENQALLAARESSLRLNVFAEPLRQALAPHLWEDLRACFVRISQTLHQLPSADLAHCCSQPAEPR